MMSTLKSQPYEIFEICLDKKFEDENTYFIEKSLLLLLIHEISQVAEQLPSEFWLSQPNTQRNPSLWGSSIQARYCLVFVAKKIHHLWPVTPFQENLTHQTRILQEELDVENCSLETAFQSEFGVFEKWFGRGYTISKDAHLVELREDSMLSRNQDLAKKIPSSHKKVVQFTPESSGLKKQEQMTLEDQEAESSVEKIRNYFQQHFNSELYIQDEDQQLKRNLHEQETGVEEEEKEMASSKAGSQKHKSTPLEFSAEGKIAVTNLDLIQTPKKNPDDFQKPQTDQN